MWSIILTYEICYFNEWLIYCTNVPSSYIHSQIYYMGKKYRSELGNIYLKLCHSQMDLDSKIPDYKDILSLN